MSIKPYFFAIITMVIGMSACVNDDTDFSEYTQKGQPTEDGDDSQTIVPMSIDLDFSDLDEGVEDIPLSGELVDEYVENDDFTSTIYVVYDGEGVELSGAVDKITYTANGAHLVVKSTQKHLHFVLSGSSENGAFKVYSDYKYRLDLNGLSLTNPTGAAINNQCGKTLYVVLGTGAVNTLRDGATYATPSTEDEKAAFFSEGQIIFSGAGMLNVYAEGKSGIASDDYIRFRPGNKIYVNSTAAHGVKANDGIFIHGGVLNIEVSANAAKGLNSAYDLSVMGGRTTVLTSGASLVEERDTSSCAALKCDSMLTVTAGTLMLKSTGEGGKGINCHKSASFSGGSVCVVTTGEKSLSSPKGIKVDRQLTVGGGDVYSYSANGKPVEGGEGLTVTENYAAYQSTDRLFEVRYE